MDLFIVVRWGSDETDDGADGPDTVFLVRADDFLKSIELAESALRSLPHQRVAASANVCIRIGQADEESHESAILLGPVYKHWHCDADSVGWLRHFPDQPWKSLADGP